MTTHSLPKLPPRLYAATLAAADNLTALAHSENIELTGSRGEPRDHLITMLYTIRERCAQSERTSQPWLGDESITLSEISTVLETIGHILVSDDNYDFAGHSPSWFMDAANVLEQIALERE